MHLFGSGEGPGGWLNNILCPILLPPVLFHKGEEGSFFTVSSLKEAGDIHTLAPTYIRHSDITNTA